MPIYPWNTTSPTAPPRIKVGKLRIAEIPARAAFTINVRVVAWQFGRGVEPLVKAATPVASKAVRVPAIAAISLVSLAALGAFGGYLDGAPLGRATLRITVGGALAMTVTTLTVEFSASPWGRESVQHFHPRGHRGIRVELRHELGVRKDLWGSAFTSTTVISSRAGISR
jgi:hypothetical protein